MESDGTDASGGDELPKCILCVTSVSASHARDRARVIPRARKAMHSALAQVQTTAQPVIAQAEEQYEDCANRHHVGTISAVGGNPRNVEPNQARSASGAEAVCEAVVTRQVDCAESLQGADKPVIDAIKDAAADGTDEAVDGTPSDDVVDDEIEDGYKYNKYGQKTINGWVHQRAYFRCTIEGCRAKKYVQKSNDGKRTIITREGTHTHAAGVVQPRKQRASPVRRLPVTPRGRQRASPAAAAASSRAVGAAADASMGRDAAAAEVPAQVAPAADPEAPVGTTEGGQRPVRKARANARSATEMLFGETCEEEPPRKKQAVPAQAEGAADGSPRESGPASSATTCAPPAAPPPADNSVDIAFELPDASMRCPLYFLALVADRLGTQI